MYLLKVVTFKRYEWGHDDTNYAQNERTETKSVFLVPTKQRMPSLYKQKSLLNVLADDLVTH